MRPGGAGVDRVDDKGAVRAMVPVAGPCQGGPPEDVRRWPGGRKQQWTTTVLQWLCGGQEREATLQECFDTEVKRPPGARAQRRVWTNEHPDTERRLRA